MGEPNTRRMTFEEACLKLCDQSPEGIAKFRAHVERTHREYHEQKAKEAVCLAKVQADARS